MLTIHVLIPSGQAAHPLSSNDIIILIAIIIIINLEEEPDGHGKENLYLISNIIYSMASYA